MRAWWYVLCDCDGNVLSVLFLCVCALVNQFFNLWYHCVSWFDGCVLFVFVVGWLCGLSCVSSWLVISRGWLFVVIACRVLWDLLKYFVMSCLHCLRLTQFVLLRMFFLFCVVCLCLCVCLFVCLFVCLCFGVTSVVCVCSTSVIRFMCVVCFLLCFVVLCLCLAV